MKISKAKIIIKYLTGGLASVVEYILDLLNELIAKLPAVEVAKYAQLAKDAANFVQNLTVLITDEKKKRAAAITAQAFADLAAALIDAHITEDELNAVVDRVKEAIDAWKEA